MSASNNLKTRTAHSLKWNLVDRLSTQVLYAITGIVLARVLDQEEFGLVGALLVFQAFASLLVNSGFSFALLQRQSPTRLDYSTVLWFNLAMASLVYLVLCGIAPLIAGWFQNDMRLVPLSRVMFLCLIFDAAGIVQNNRLIKSMDVRMVAASNALGLFLGACVGIGLALAGYGAWALVWQALIISAVKTIVLWVTSRWRPLLQFSWTVLKSYFGLGSKMMLTAFLNTLFQKIYAFVIGNRVSLLALGYYSQSDKWSTMGVASLSQVFSSSFVPPLSAVQHDKERYANMVSKINRFTAYILFPLMLGLIAMATPIFHALFGTKWDPSIILFQILVLRGIFTVLNSLYNNYLLALGHGTAIVRLEIVRDVAAIVALVACLPFLNMSTDESPVLGIEILLWGQLGATFVMWVASLGTVVHLTGVRLAHFFADMLPYVVQTLIIIPIMLLLGSLAANVWIELLLDTAVALTLYVGANYLLRSRVQKDVFDYIRGKQVL